MVICTPQWFKRHGATLVKTFFSNDKYSHEVADVYTFSFFGTLSLRNPI